MACSVGGLCPPGAVAGAGPAQQTPRPRSSAADRSRARRSSSGGPARAGDDTAGRRPCIGRRRGRLPPIVQIISLSSSGRPGSSAPARALRHPRSPPHRPRAVAGVYQREEHRPGRADRVDRSRVAAHGGRPGGRRPGRVGRRRRRHHLPLWVASRRPAPRRPQHRHRPRERDQEGRGLGGPGHAQRRDAGRGGGHGLDDHPQHAAGGRRRARAGAFRHRRCGRDGHVLRRRRDPVTCTYTWLVDGSEVQSGASDTLAAGRFAKHQRVTIELGGLGGVAAGLMIGAMLR